MKLSLCWVGYCHLGSRWGFKYMEKESHFTQYNSELSVACLVTSLRQFSSVQYSPWYRQWPVNRDMKSPTLYQNHMKALRITGWIFSWRLLIPQPGQLCLRIGWNLGGPKDQQEQSLTEPWQDVIGAERMEESAFWSMKMHEIKMDPKVVQKQLISIHIVGRIIFLV